MRECVRIGCVIVGCVRIGYVITSFSHLERPSSNDDSPAPHGHYRSSPTVTPN